MRPVLSIVFDFISTIFWCIVSKQHDNLRWLSNSQPSISLRSICTNVWRFKKTKILIEWKDELAYEIGCRRRWRCCWGYFIYYYCIFQITITKINGFDNVVLLPGNAFNKYAKKEQNRVTGFLILILIFLKKKTNNTSIFDKITSKQSKDFQPIVFFKIKKSIIRK